MYAPASVGLQVLGDVLGYVFRELIDFQISALVDQRLHIRQPKPHHPTIWAICLQPAILDQSVNEAALYGEKIDAQTAFLTAWKAAVAGEVPVHYGKDDADDLLTKGKALVSGYVPPGGIIGVEQPFRFELDDLPPIEGRIDLIRKEGDNLILADLKTSGTKVVTETDSVEAQLGLYNIVYPATHHEIIVLAKLKVATITVQPIVPWNEHQVKNHYNEVYAAMKAGIRYAVRGWQCQGCSFYNRCQKDRS